MARRLPSQPPVLAGFTHLHVLGSGGFADVFLYEQSMPRRQVAVKVMLSEVVNDQVRQMFQAEANLMAQLSAHPSILTVHQASISADGRPYLVMELCSASLTERYRRERLPVPEVLRIAVKIGSAVETAHRAGVLHRDLKPSNILMTAYGHPVLSDFGIAASVSELGEQESIGLSIPWSAPEVLMDETPGTVASEVWSLGATVYSLLAGRSPFEIPGDKNSSADLISRINRAKPQPIGRPDVPASLERLLIRSMSKKPADRPASAIEFVRELQAIETELGVPQTAVEVAMEEWATSTVSAAEDRTIVKGAGGAVPPAPGKRRRRRAAAAEQYQGVGTMVRSQPAASTGRAAPAAQTGGVRALTIALIVASVVITAVGAVAIVQLLRGAGGGVPVVADLQASETSGGTVRFSWSEPSGFSDGDQYEVQVTGGASSLQLTREFTVEANADDRVCATVTVNRAGETGDASAERCIDVEG